MKIPCTLQYPYFFPVHVYTYWAIVLDSNSIAAKKMDILSVPKKQKVDNYCIYLPRQLLYLLCDITVNNCVPCGMCETQLVGPCINFTVGSQDRLTYCQLNIM